MAGINTAPFISIGPSGAAFGPFSFVPPSIAQPNTLTPTPITTEASASPSTATSQSSPSPDSISNPPVPSLSDTESSISTPPIPSLSDTESSISTPLLPSLSNTESPISTPPINSPSATSLSNSSSPNATQFRTTNVTASVAANRSPGPFTSPSSVTETLSPTHTTKFRSNPAAARVGGIVGGLIAFMLLLFAIGWWWRRRVNSGHTTINAYPYTSWNNRTVPIPYSKKDVTRSHPTTATLPDVISISASQNRKGDHMRNRLEADLSPLPTESAQVVARVSLIEVMPPPVAEVSRNPSTSTMDSAILNDLEGIAQAISPLITERELSPIPPLMTRVHHDSGLRIPGSGILDIPPVYSRI